MKLPLVGMLDSVKWKEALFVAKDVVSSASSFELGTRTGRGSESDFDSLYCKDVIATTRGLRVESVVDVRVFVP
jgi:hypothetical protein